MRTLIVGLLLGGTLSAQIAISPVNPVVAQGNTVKFTAKTSVSWSLAPGSPGTIDADGTYHAPPHVTPKAIVGGCQVLPNDHLYNTRVDALPVDAHSKEWITAAPNHVGLPRLGDFGINLFTNAEEQVPQQFMYTPGTAGSFYIAPPGSCASSMVPTLTMLSAMTAMRSQLIATPVRRKRSTLPIRWE